MPVRDAFAWHQGRWAEGRARKRRSRARLGPRMAQCIAHDVYRQPRAGCSYAVPRCVVTVAGCDVAAERVARTVERILADPVHDLAVRIERLGGDERLGWLQDRFGSDPRVRVPASGSALDEFPTAAFHVTVPAGARLCAAPIRRLRARLGLAVTATVRLGGGATMSITRTWALHRARRTGGCAGDFGDARRVARWRLRVPECSVAPLVRRLGRRVLRRGR